MSTLSPDRMSAVSRQSGHRSAATTPCPCDCPECSGESVGLAESIESMVAGIAELVEGVDPIDAEMLGATLLALADDEEDADAADVLGVLVEQFEAGANPEAVALLLSIGSVADPAVAGRAVEAARRLVDAGVPEPAWAGELRAPVTVVDCWRAGDLQDADSVLIGTFRRAGRSHSLMITVDHDDCGAADGIFLLDVDQVLPLLQAAVSTAAGSNTKSIRRVRLEPAEFRWLVQNALDARAVHDAPLPADEAVVEFDEDEAPFDDDIEQPDAAEDDPPYPVLAALLRARLRTLPEPNRPPAPHANPEPPRSPLDLLVRLMNGTALNGLSMRADFPGLPWTRELPPQRRKKDGPAPVYQIKVSLRGAKPPIWRRLEVPADISLADLSRVIQVSFGWHGGHLHVFETPFGEFGATDADLGHRSDATVTLEQVAGDVKDKVRYTYDFGDDWDHDILVEKVLDPAGRTPGLRCTGGRRASPPEDCGGIGGYEELIDILGDPDNARHQEMLDWLGLDDAGEFDPALFDAREVTDLLAHLR